MGNNKHFIPENEMERLLALSELDLDYTNLNEQFADLTELAAKVTGTDISLINLLDTFTQWSISTHGIAVEQTPRENTVCKQTIMSDQPFEIPDLGADEQWRNNDMVTALGLKYYYGLPLQLEKGINIGTLCVLDHDLKRLSPEKVELLKIIAQTVVKRLKSLRQIELMQNRINRSDDIKKKVAHDIRGPISGIIGLSEIMATQDPYCSEDMSMCISMINKSGKSLLELADEILSDDEVRTPREDEFTLNLFKDKLVRLYSPQAAYKNIALNVTIDTAHAAVIFSKNKLIQIAGNMVSNAIKFTPVKGTIDVWLAIERVQENQMLRIEVKDSGIGMEPEQIDIILAGKAATTSGTFGEKGYGFGLNLVLSLVQKLNGVLTIESIPNAGTTFSVLLPQSKS